MDANSIKYFETDDGKKNPAVTREQMIEIDKIAINETRTNLFQMMENAGRDLSELTSRFVNNKTNIILVQLGKEITEGEVFVQQDILKITVII